MIYCTKKLLWIIKTSNYSSFLAFLIQVGLFLNFRKIEPTVSYKLFLVKKYVYLEVVFGLNVLCPALHLAHKGSWLTIRL